MEYQETTGICFRAQWRLQHLVAWPFVQEPSLAVEGPALVPGALKHTGARPRPGPRPAPGADKHARSPVWHFFLHYEAPKPHIHQETAPKPFKNDVFLFWRTRTFLLPAAFFFQTGAEPDFSSPSCPWNSQKLRDLSSSKTRLQNVCLCARPFRLWGGICTYISLYVYI